MMLSRLWGRITGKDKDLKYPDQQSVFLGRVGEYIVVFPYGLYADLPSGTLLKEIASGVAVPVTVERPSDTAQAEPVFFHPTTNTRIIARNNGDLDIIGDDGASRGSLNINVVNANITASANVEVECVEANITASASATITTPETTITGNTTIGGNLQVDGDFNNDGKATLGGAGGNAIARTDDTTDGSKITGGSGNHTAT